MIRKGAMRTESNTASINEKVRPFLLLVAGACLVLGSLSCGGGGQSGGSPSIAFAATPLSPPPSLGVGAIVSFAAVVTGDTGAQGVNWTVTCTPGTGTGASCGTITSHTASGYPTTYTAPNGSSNLSGYIPGQGGTVTVTAAATADPSKSVSIPIQITLPQVAVGFNTVPPNSMLTGATANVIVSAQNDSTSAGADLSLTCGSTVAGACGSIVPAHTDGIITGNNSVAVYTAPLAVPPGVPLSLDVTMDGTVAITAVSTADITQSAVTYVTIAQAPLAIALSQAPPPSLPVGATTNLTAIVTLDAFNVGVDWSASCQSASQSNSCGTFSLTHTASGEMTTYIAPSTVPAGNLVVTITAASTTIPTTTATALVTVTPADLRDDLLNGQYVFLLQGVREGGAWAIAGSLVADGIGDIDLATETFLGDNTSYSLSGSYFIDGDGTGTITLNGAPTGLGYWNDGQQIFKVNMVSPGFLSMEEFDGYYDPTLHVAYGGTLTGTLKQQTVTASLTPSSGSYAFLLSGFGPQNTPAYYAGTFNGTSQNFTMDRSIAGVSDPIPLTGTVTFPSPNIIFTDNTGQYSYVFKSYVVDSGHWILIGTANQSQSGSGDLAAGHLYLQPTPAGTVATVCPNPASYYSFTEAGATPMISTTTQPSAQGSLPLAMGGVFSCVAPGNVTGFLDANINGNVSSNDSVSGAMTMSPTSNGSGTSGTLTLATGGTPPVTHTFDVYPTATHGILMLQTDQLTQSQTTGVYLPAGVGTAYLQTQAGASATSFIASGPYIAAYQSLGAFNPANGEATNGEVGAWSDFLGVLNVNDQSTLEGSVDLDQFDESSKALWTQTPDATLTGNFSAGAHGRFTGSFSICSTTTPATPCQPSSSGSTSPLITSNQVFYIVDGSTVLSLGIDPAPPAGTIGIGPSTGILQAQPQQF